jgi:hypothetical protein
MLWYLRVVVARNSRSDIGNARCPCFRDPLDFLNEAPTRDLCRTNLLLGVGCNRRMVIRVVERVAQQLDVRCLQCPERLAHVSKGSFPIRVEPTGFRSASRSPTAVAALLSKAVAGLPSMSTTTTILTPVLVSHPYMASLSSTAWRSPKSWSAVLYGKRASKISRHDESRNWNSRDALSSAGKSEMCKGLF